MTSLFLKRSSAFIKKRNKSKVVYFLCNHAEPWRLYSRSTLKGTYCKTEYDTEYPLAETYLSLARESDSAFKELLEYFEKVDEPTMIVMFGDHWPKIEEEFMAKLLGGNRQSLDLLKAR